MVSDYMWPPAITSSTPPSVAVPHQLIDLHHILPYLPASSNETGGVHLTPYIQFDGWNLTLDEHKQLLLEAARHFPDGGGGGGRGDLSAEHCPSLEMPIGNAISMVLYAIVFFVGLVGNTLVIYVVVRFSKMQTVTNMYILNLAVADECFLIGIPFLIYTMQTGAWTLGKWACKAYMISTSITQFTSSIFLFIMSADRYMAVCHPISATRFRSPYVSKVVSAGAWVASALMMVPVFWFANTIERDGEERMSCNIEWSAEYEGSGFTFTLYSFVMGFAVPLTMILAFYYLVLKKLRTVGPKTKSKEKKRSHRKVTKLVLTVITVYVLCWLPYWISQVALISSSPEVCHSRLQVTMFVLVGCLGYSNSAMNPILYAFLSDNFKKSFMKACTCAAGKDLNTQLQMENSLFPRFGKRGTGGSERGGGGGGGAGGGGGGGGGNGEGRAAGCGGDGGGGFGSGRSKMLRMGGGETHQRFGMLQHEFNGGADVTSDSAQTKSTANSLYKSNGSSGGGVGGGGGGGGGGANIRSVEELSSERPPVLHTDL